MFYSEIEAKRILASAGGRVPYGQLWDSKVQWPDHRSRMVYLKAQVLEGGRGRRNLVRRVSVEMMHQAAAQLAEISMAPVLVEEAIRTQHERYVAIGIDVERQAPCLYVASEGGVDVELMAAASLRFQPISMAHGLRPMQTAELSLELGISRSEARELGRLAECMWHVFLEQSAELVEVNPAVWDGRWMWAADVKLLTYGSHVETGFVFFRRNGPVAVLSSGAGLGMAIGDMLVRVGTPPANFSDLIGGVHPGAVQELCRNVFLRARESDVRVILAAFSYSLTPLERLLEPMLQEMTATPPGIPICGFFSSGDARRSGIGFELLEQLREHGVRHYPTLEEAFNAAVLIAQE